MRNRQSQLLVSYINHSQIFSIWESPIQRLRVKLVGLKKAKADPRFSEDVERLGRTMLWIATVLPKHDIQPQKQQGAGGGGGGAAKGGQPRASSSSAAQKCNDQEEQKFCDTVFNAMTGPHRHDQLKSPILISKLTAALANVNIKSPNGPAKEAKKKNKKLLGQILRDDDAGRFCLTIQTTGTTGTSEPDFLVALTKEKADTKIAVAASGNAEGAQGGQPQISSRSKGAGAGGGGGADTLSRGEGTDADESIQQLKALKAYDPSLYFLVRWMLDERDPPDMHGVLRHPYFTTPAEKQTFGVALGLGKTSGMIGSYLCENPHNPNEEEASTALWNAVKDELTIHLDHQLSIMFEATAGK